MTNNYNLHIWDRQDDHEDDWVISFYRLDSGTENVYNGIGHDIELDIWLLQEEARQLGLGEPRSMWIESKDFFDTFSNVPKRVRDHMQSIPSY